VSLHPKSYQNQLSMILSTGAVVGLIVGLNVRKTQLRMRIFQQSDDMMTCTMCSISATHKPNI